MFKVQIALNDFKFDMSSIRLTVQSIVIFTKMAQKRHKKNLDWPKVINQFHNSQPTLLYMMMIHECYKRSIADV